MNQFQYRPHLAIERVVNGFLVTLPLRGDVHERRVFPCSETLAGFVLAWGQAEEAKASAAALKERTTVAAGQVVPQRPADLSWPDWAKSQIQQNRCPHTHTKTIANGAGTCLDCGKIFDDRDA